MLLFEVVLVVGVIALYGLETGKLRWYGLDDDDVEDSCGAGLKLLLYDACTLVRRSCFLLWHSVIRRTRIFICVRGLVRTT